jgi:diadenosine tetraphosphatase ApaH/serine/threonine PP2A family protein phosphatase
MLPMFPVAHNHDYGVAGETRLENFNVHARIAAEWTRNELDERDLDFLRGLDLVERSNRFSVVHASLTAPESWGYILDIDDAYENFQLLKRQVCFIGHSHKPVVFVANDIVDCRVAERTVLDEGSSYFVNIGSVGQPRDGDPRAAYCVFDDDKGIIDIKRVSYDIKKAQEKIIRAGLPRLLAERLAQGR